jgi:two-component system NarL family sensor kinase
MNPKIRMKITMNEQAARRLSWSIAAFSILLAIGGLVISILAQRAAGTGVIFSHQFFTPLLTITYCGVGALVASRHPRNPIGWMFCATGFLSAVNMLAAGYALYVSAAAPAGFLPGASLARWLNTWIWLPNVLLPITFLLLLFPDGKLFSSRWRPIAIAAGVGIVVFTLSIALHPGPLESMGMNEPNPLGLAGSADMINAMMIVAAPLLLIGIVGSIASVVVRFRSARGIERAQLKWLAFAGVIVIVANVLGGVPWLIWGDDPITQEFYIIVTDITVVSIVAAAGIAILRYRLWDIHILINRTLVYGALTALVVAIYVVIVGTFGVLLQTGGSTLVSLFGTGIVALSFQPMRERLQHGVNRLMYGERDDPYVVLGRLSQRLEMVSASQSVLPTIAETVADAFKLPYAAIALKEGTQFIIAAKYVRSSAFSPADCAVEILPLVYQLETIGQMILAPRAPGELFSPPDRQLLESIARQAGVVVYNVRLTQDLQRSRERLVTTREEERRRLRRDLHDELGPIIAAMSFKLDVVHNLAEHDTNAVKKTATELKAQMQGVLTDIRRIAYDLRPPALDELGLVGALKEHIASHNQVQGLQITLEAPETPPPLPAAVEVAAYRIALEAITNVSRHAKARHCSVRLSLVGDLCLEVIDDGRGLPDEVRAGVGLISMRERAEELGGTCRTEALPQGGTEVMARLPVSIAKSALLRELNGFNPRLNC